VRQQNLERLAVEPTGGSVDPKAWAWKLRAREMAGEQLGRAQREAWREALAEREPQAPTVPLKAPRPFNETERDEA